MLCVLKYGVCWSLSFSLFPLSYLCGVLYNMIVHVHVHCNHMIWCLYKQHLFVIYGGIGIRILVGALKDLTG